jgi:hypothetical protein
LPAAGLRWLSPSPGLKLTLCEIHKALPKDAKIIATVHDEIIVGASEAKAERVKKLLAKITLSSHKEPKWISGAELKRVCG